MSAGGSNRLVCSKKTISALLNGMLSPDQDARDAAEEKLVMLKKVDVFGLHLTKIVLDQSYQLAVRQLASEHLEKYANTHLCSRPISLERNKIKLKSKPKIKKLLLTGLRECNYKIRKAVASVVSDIAGSDWSTNWPGLGDVLLDHLRETLEFAVDGAMQVLYISSQSTCMTELQIDNPVILHEMCRIFEAEIQYSIGIRSQAVKILTKIIEECEPGFLREHLEPTIPRFCTKMVQHLSEKDVTSSDICGLKANIVKAITELIREVPKCISDYLPKMLPLIWRTVQDSAQVYQADTVNDSRDVENEETDSDGEIINNFENLIQSILDFIYVLLSPHGQHNYRRHTGYDLPDYHWSYLQNSLSSEVLHHLLFFMQVTDNKIELWSNDPGIKRSIEARAITDALIVGILKQMEVENAIRVSFIPEVSRTRWKLREAFLLAFCLVKDIIVEKQNEGTLHFDMVAFLENVVLADLNNPDSHPFLIGRCLCVGGLYAQQMPPDMASRFLIATVNGLQNQSSCTRICAAIAVEHWFRVSFIEGNESYKEVLNPHLPALFRGLFALGIQSESENISELIARSLYDLASFHEAFTTSVAPQIFILISTTYSKFSGYGNNRTLCKLVLEQFTLNPEYTVPLQKDFVPKLIEHEDFKIADMLVRHSPQPLGKLLIKSLFPALCKYILRVSAARYRSILENEGKLICTYLTKAAQQVLGYRDEHGKTGEQYILQVAAQLLNSRSTDPEALVAWEIMILLLKNAGNTLGMNVPDMQQLLEAMLCRMRASQTESVLRRNLLIVWAHLINLCIDSILNFFSITHFRVGQTGRTAEVDALSFVICDGFFGKYTSFESGERKTVVQALCKILQYGITHHGSVLHEIFIKESEGSVTTVIPLLVKICKLITTTISSQVEELGETQDVQEE